MKKIVFSLILLLFLTGGTYSKKMERKGPAPQKIANKMAEEVCSAMDLYDESNPQTLIKTSEALEKILKKGSKYKDVTETQLLDAMKEKCPAGLRKFASLVEEGQKSE